MNQIKQTIISIMATSVLLPALLFTTEAHANFIKSGIINTVNYHATGLFWRQVGHPFRITHSGYEEFYLKITTDSEATNYQYDLALKPNKANTIQLTTTGNDFCIINFTPISPTQARFDVTDGTQHGCGINENGDIAFNFNS